MTFEIGLRQSPDTTQAIQLEPMMTCNFTNSLNISMLVDTRVSLTWFIGLLVLYEREDLGIYSIFNILLNIFFENQ